MYFRLDPPSLRARRNWKMFCARLLSLNEGIRPKPLNQFVLLQDMTTVLDQKCEFLKTFGESCTAFPLAEKSLGEAQPIGSNSNEGCPVFMSGAQ